MSMDRERGSYVAPEGSPPPGFATVLMTVQRRIHNVFMVEEKHVNDFDLVYHLDATVIRHAQATMALHVAEAEAWDAFADREEQADRIGEPAWTAPGWQAERDELRRRARDLGRQLDTNAAALADLVAVTPLGVSGKALVLAARDEVEADTSTGGMRALRLSVLRDALAVEAAAEGGRADA